MPDLVLRRITNQCTRLVASGGYQQSAAASVTDPMFSTASKAVDDEGSILFNIAQVCALSFLWFAAYVMFLE